MARNNSPLGMQFRTCENFEESTDSSLVLSSKFSQIQKPHRKSFDSDSLHESATKETQSYNPPSLRGESTDSPKQSKQNNRVSAHQISPDSWCKKSESKGAVVPPADFLLESELRGSPPKSEKRQLLARRGSGAGGAALLRKEIGESKRNKIVGDSNVAKMDCHESTNTESRNDSIESPQDEFTKTPKFRSVIVGASGLSLGISIVVAILLGIGAGILMQKIFDTFWVLFLGVFWGIAAAVLNVYKVYKAELRDFEKLANDPKYKNINPK